VPGRQVSATVALAPALPPVSAVSTTTPSRSRTSDRLMPEVMPLQLTNELAATTPPPSSGVPIDMEQETAADAGAAGTTTEARSIVAAASNPRRGSHCLMFMAQWSLRDGEPPA